MKMIEILATFLIYFTMVKPIATPVPGVAQPIETTQNCDDRNGSPSPGCGRID